jgi:hypothetical protein
MGNPARWNFALAALGIAAATAAGSAQDPGGEPAFEVVSVKPFAMENGAYGTGLFPFPGGRIRANMCKLD